MALASISATCLLANLASECFRKLLPCHHQATLTLVLHIPGCFAIAATGQRKQRLYSNGGLLFQAHEVKGRRESRRDLYAPCQWADCQAVVIGGDWDGGQFRPAKKSSCKDVNGKIHEPHESRWPIMDGCSHSSGNSPSINMPRWQPSRAGPQEQQLQL